MPAQIPYALGSEQVFYLAEEAAWNTWQAWAGTDAMAVLKTGFDQKQPRVTRDDTRKSRSLFERMTGRKAGSWQIDSYLCGSGVAGTEPDVAPLLKGLFGSQADVGGVSNEWTLGASQCPTSLQMLRVTDVFSQVLNGCIVDEGSFDFTGGPVKASFKGRNVWQTFANAILGDGTIATNTFTAQSDAMAGQVDENSVMIVDGTAGEDDGDGDDGLRVTDVTGSVLTFDDNLDANHSARPLKPYRPDPTYLGTPATDVVGSLTVDGGQLDLVSAKIVVSNNLNMVENIWGKDRAVYGFFLRRFVTVSLSVQYRRDMGFHYDDARNFRQGALTIISGADAAGSGDRYTWTMPVIELDMVPIDTPEENVSMLNFTGHCIATGTGENEISAILE